MFVLPSPIVHQPKPAPDLFGPQPAFVKVQPAPQFPAFPAGAKYKGKTQAQIDCEAAGGSFSSSGCAVPQPPAPAPQPAPVAAPAPSYDGSAKMNIYMHESGNDPKRANASGCLGLGQACPGSKLLAVCPGLDYACEDAYFTQYAVGRYGSWEAAWAFWQANSWW